MDDLVSDAKLVSSLLLLAGFPNEWNSSTVQRIGITNNNQIINLPKLSNLFDVSYLNAKKLLGTIYDFSIFFRDEDGNMISLGGNCSYGSPNIVFSMTLKNTTYYDKEDSKLEDEMDEIEAELGITIDKGWNNMNQFIDQIFEYKVAIIEKPKFNSQNRQKIENWVSSGNIVFMSSELLPQPSGSILGATYNKENDCGFGTVEQDDLFLKFDIGESLEHNDCDYITGDVTTIAKLSDGTKTITTWNYGKGSVYYFGDFSTKYLGSEELYKDVIKDAIKKRIPECRGFEKVDMEYDNLVKVERFVIFNSKLAKMILYLWN